MIRFKHGVSNYYEVDFCLRNLNNIFFMLIKDVHIVVGRLINMLLNF